MFLLSATRDARWCNFLRMYALLSSLVSPLRFLAFQTVLTLALLMGGCGQSTSDTRVGECSTDADCATGERCSIASVDPGSGRCVTPECMTDKDCQEAYDSEAVGCDSEGECAECPHNDPTGSFLIETPEFWDPAHFQSGEELGLDPQLAYWAIVWNTELLQDVEVCDPITIEDGEVVDTGAGCELLDANDFTVDGSSVVVPVAPSAWLSSDPVDGLYYTRVWLNFDVGPDYRCDELR